MDNKLKNIMEYISGLSAYQLILTQALIHGGYINKSELVTVLENNIDILISTNPASATPLKAILKSITGQDYPAPDDEGTHSQTKGKKGSRELPDWFRGVF